MTDMEVAMIRKGAATSSSLTKYSNPALKTMPYAIKNREAE